jgi:hypothetical protein
LTRSILRGILAVVIFLTMYEFWPPGCCMSLHFVKLPSLYWVNQSLIKGPPTPRRGVQDHPPPLRGWSWGTPHGMAKIMKIADFRFFSIFLKIFEIRSMTILKNFADHQKIFGGDSKKIFGGRKYFF